MPRRLLLLLAAFAVLTLTSLAGIATAAQAGVGAQNRVWALQTDAPTLIGLRAAESPCTRQGSISSTARIAAGFCVAAEGRPVAIGEDMANRVQPYADRAGADTYQPDSSAPESEWEQNQRDWINKQIDDGRVIHDRGPSPGYPNFPGISSPWYGIEKQTLADRNYQVTSVDC